MAKVLVVEDDEQLRSLVAELLKSEKHTVDTADDGISARILLGNSHYDLLILDWNLSDQTTGIDIIKEHRAGGGNTPILMLTGKTDYDDRETGLDSGADDYLCKPFHPREFGARVRALLRRVPKIVGKVLKVKQVELDSTAFRVTVAGKEIKLFPKEFALLEFLMRHPNQVFNNDSILDSVWSTDSAATVETLRQVMARLRSKLENAGASGLITTVYGVGYKLEDI
ncbi:MAG: response regulator transcription factor [Candidatus Obscuribacter sp.]|nr:response regulator transcription factor [Candidatus Obscuribacter sp.]